jgi:hypothetical protein
MFYSETQVYHMNRILDAEYQLLASGLTAANIQALRTLLDPPLMPADADSTPREIPAPDVGMTLGPDDVPLILPDHHPTQPVQFPPALLQSIEYRELDRDLEDCEGE